jgi:hypothetical protein
MPQDNRPPRYIERDSDGNETVIYRASSMMICERALVALASGMSGAPRPAWFQQVLDEGAIVEGDIAAMHEDETGIPTVNDQAEVELEIGEIDGRRVIVRGHIDGEADGSESGPHEVVGREFKKFRDSTWPTFLRQGIEINANYPWQASVYWHGREWTALEFVGGHITGYQCGIDINRIHTAPDGPDVDGFECDPACINRQPIVGEIVTKHLDAPPIAMKDIRRRIVRFERLIAEGNALLDVPCGKSMFPCPFYTLHDEDESTEYTLPTDKHTIEVVQTLVNIDTRASDLRAQLRELDKAKKVINVELRAIVSVEGQDADEAKHLICNVGNNVTHRLTRKRYHQPAKEIGAYDVDSFSMEKPAKPKSRLKPRKDAPAAKAVEQPVEQPARAAKATKPTRKTGIRTTRVGGKR